jgi:hypothetical protein
MSIQCDKCNIILINNAEDWTRNYEKCRNCDEPWKENAEAMRTAPTGATRDILEGKLEYFKFFSIYAFKKYVEYMFGKRIQPNGGLRDADNWQKGMPRQWYYESLERHAMDIVFHSKGASELAEEDQETALCALIFNAQALLHEIALGRDVQEEDVD